MVEIGEVRAMIVKNCVEMNTSLSNLLTKNFMTIQ